MPQIAPPTHSAFHRLRVPPHRGWTLVVDSQLAMTGSGEPYRYIRTGAYATILGNEVACAKLSHSGKWGEPFIRKGAKKVKAARVIYW